MAAYLLTIHASEGFDVTVVDEYGIQYKNGESVPAGKYLKISHSILPGYEFTAFRITHGGSTQTYSEGDPVFIGSVTTEITIEAVASRAGLVHIHNGSGFSDYQIFICTETGWAQYVPHIFIDTGWYLCG